MFVLINTINMKQNLSDIGFRSEIDINCVVPGLEIDLEECLKTGFVPSSGVDVQYNGIEDLDFISGRIEDAFDAFEEARRNSRIISAYREHLASEASKSSNVSTDKSVE